MGKFTYLNADEIVAHVEKFGTDDERDIIAKIDAEPDWSMCPYCDQAHTEADINDQRATEAEQDRDELSAGIKDAYTKLSSALALIEQAQEDME